MIEKVMHGIAPYVPILLIVGFGASVFLNRKKLVVDVDDMENSIQRDANNQIVDKFPEGSYILAIKEDDGKYTQISDVIEDAAYALIMRGHVLRFYRGFLKEATDAADENEVNRWNRMISNLRIILATEEHYGFKKEGK